MCNRAIKVAVLKIALIATFALFFFTAYSLAGAQLYVMTPRKYTFLNRSVSGACAGTNIPHPSQINGGVTPTKNVWKVLAPTNLEGVYKSNLNFMCFHLFWH